MDVDMLLKDFQEVAFIGPARENSAGPVAVD
jgi:hypothetical protein